MKTTITIEDTTNEIYYINPRNVAYVKEKKNTGSTRRTSSWKIALVNGESIITKNGKGVKALVSSFLKKKMFETKDE
jgi:hypothetical protein